MHQSNESLDDNNGGQNESILASAKSVFLIESQAIAALSDQLDDQFIQVVHLLDQCRGHLVVTGVGKSGLIGTKIAATFSSIGIPALFLHAAEASHGDLGILTREDIVIAISNSGETEEILKLLPYLNRFKATLVSLTGSPQSTLARRSDYVLDVGVSQEACSMDLVPTASTTATLAMGDALAIALVHKRGIDENDFAQNHPGGSLGRKLLTTVADLMHVGDQIPRVDENSDICSVLTEMSGKGFGMTVVVDGKDQLLGIITDGDLRRLIETQKDFKKSRPTEFMVRNPKTIRKDKMATKALQIMEEHSITSLVVSEDQKEVDGIIHLHDLLKAGIV